MNTPCVFRATQLLKFFYSNVCTVLPTSSIRHVNVSRCLVQTCLISSSFTCYTPEENGKPPKKKTRRTPEITLLQPDNSMIVTTLAVAEKLANRRNLSLIKVEDISAKTKRETYSLVAPRDFVAKTEEEQKTSSDSSRKAEKLITIQSKIHKSDLLVKCRQISRMVSKKHVVRVGIFSEGGQNEELIKNIQNTIVEHMKDKAQCVCFGTKTRPIIMVHPLDTDNK